MEAKKLGGQPDLPFLSDWEQVKDDVMRKAVLQKFRTHADIRAIPLSTLREE
jgi:N-glycosidase YbiA